uniref:WAP domain-containing protein n=1 Tax=Hippocampus comes TaxID=109280 RepID=A0A3Q2ZA39_HIPCM
MDKYAVCALVFALGAFVQFHPVFTQDSPKTVPNCPLPQGTCASNCFHDGQCPGDQKCCQAACGHTCSQPL